MVILCSLAVVVLALGAPSGAGAAAPDAPAKPLPVLQYLGARASRLEAALPPLPERPADWSRRRAEVRRELTALLGLPAREPMRARVLASRVEGELTIENVIYLWAERCYVPGIVVRPTQVSGRLPAVVVPPGFGGAAKTLDQNYYRPFVQRMARQGYVVLFFDDPSFGDRQAPLAAWYAVTSAAGMQGMGVQVFDTLRGLDYLLTRPEVDPGRVGVAGLCQGSEQTWLAGALDDRFQVVVPVCGTTTYTDWARMPGYLGVVLSSADPYLKNVLRHTDWPEIGACIAPRPLYIASNSGDNWWPEAGYRKVVAALQKIYALQGRPENFQHLRDLRSHSMTPYLPELGPWLDCHLKALPETKSVAPQPCGEPPADADVKPLRYFQRLIARQADALPAEFRRPRDWRRYRETVTQWLRQACLLDEMHLGAVRSEGFENAGQVKTEKVVIEQDQGLALSVKIFRPMAPAAPRAPAVVLSHADKQCAAAPAVLNIARALAEAGYTVAVPDHASTDGRSARPVGSIVSLYGAGDVTGLSPLAMRVWDDVAALAVLRRSGGVGPVALAGLGLGGVDAAITAALNENVAGLAAVGVITVRDWAERVAPGDYQVMPYLPGLMPVTDWPYVYSAALPRPVLLADGADRANWPAEAAQRVQQMAAHVAALEGAAARLTCRPAAADGGLADLRAWLQQILPPPARGNR